MTEKKQQIFYETEVEFQQCMKLFRPYKKMQDRIMGNVNLLRMENLEKEDQYVMIKEIITQDISEHKQIKDYYQDMVKSQHCNVLKLYAFYQNEEFQMFKKLFKTTLLFEYGGLRLSDDFQSRKKEQNYLTENEFRNLI